MTAKSTKQDKSTDSAAKVAETMVSAGQETLRGFAKASAENYEKTFAGLRGMDGIGAWSAAGAAYGKGMEAISGEMMSFAKQMLDGNVAATKAILGAKTLNEVMELNSEYARGSFDGLMVQGTKVAELATKVAQDTVEPLNAQFTATVEKWGQNAA